MENRYSLYQVLKEYDIMCNGEQSDYKTDPNKRKKLQMHWERACQMFVPKMYEDYLKDNKSKTSMRTYGGFSKEEKDFFIELLEKYETDELWGKFGRVNYIKRIKEGTKEGTKEGIKEGIKEGTKEDFVGLLEKDNYFQEDEIDRVEEELSWALSGFQNLLSNRIENPEEKKTSVYKGYKRDKIEMRVDRVEVSDFPLYLNTVAGGLDRRDQTIGGFSFVVKIYTVPVVEIIG